jgi:hypothetical protein
MATATVQIAHWLRVHPGECGRAVEVAVGAVQQGALGVQRVAQRRDDLTAVVHDVGFRWGDGGGLAGGAPEPSEGCDRRAAWP